MRYLPLTIILTCLLFVTTFAIADPQSGGHSPNVVKALDNYESQKALAVQQISAGPARQNGRSFFDANSQQYDATAMAKKMFSFEMGFETYRYRYEETVEGGHFMDLKGVFKGIYTKLAWRLQGQGDNEWKDFIDQLAVDARLAFARLDYTGGVSDGLGFEQDLTLSDTPDMVTEIRFTGGKDFVWQGVTFTPFSGLGFRHLIDDSSDQSAIIDYYGTPVEITGYKRKSYYYYLPIGLSVAKTFSNAWQVGITTEFDQLLTGTQKSQVETDTGRVLTNHQNSGYGLRGSIRLAKDFQHFGLAIEPFFRYWNIEDSDWAPTEVCSPGVPCMGGMEPSNTTKEGGVRVGITF